MKRNKCCPSVVWKGKKEEGMTYRQKSKLLKELDKLTGIHGVVMKEVRTEEERIALENKFSLERAAQIDKASVRQIRKSMKILSRLPKEILDKVSNTVAFSFGYYSDEVGALLEKYYEENTVN